jgi:two-component system sensor histidine kinase EvgS
MLIWGLTADVSQQERDRCLEVGLNLLLFKPINLQKLASLLQTVKPRATKNALESIIDMEAFGFLSMGDPVLMQRILTHARDESERDLQGIHRAIALNDWVVAKNSLHRLAGTVQILGATAIVQRCETLKQYLQADNKCSSIQSEMDELIVQLELLFSAIDEFMAKPIL